MVRPLRLSPDAWTAGTVPRASASLNLRLQFHEALLSSAYSKPLQEPSGPIREIFGCSARFAAGSLPIQGVKLRQV